MTDKVSSQIAISVATGDVLSFPADVLALKYAQSLYGADRAIVGQFESEGVDIASRLPKPSQVRLIKSVAGIAPGAVLFVGVASLWEFGYEEIRNFGYDVLESLSSKAPGTRHLALTVHGVGYGLDEAESFDAEVAGLLEALTEGKFPRALERITIVELDGDRAGRLRAMLPLLIPDGIVRLTGAGLPKNIRKDAKERLRVAGRQSAAKPRVFVAMPFGPKRMDDIFHYGIEKSVKAAGFLCERADLAAFTGDVVEWVKNRIAQSSLLIADLSTANPNVYLEVGYAWGRDIPTVLLVDDTNDLKFDVKGQRCLVYGESIKCLEDLLRKELKSLRSVTP